VSLQGSLETFALPDVLVLLASTKKDGELRVVGGKVDGHIWVEMGQIVHSDVNGRETASVDAVFELLRLDAGTFSFEPDSEAPARHEADMIDLVLADAQVRLGEWKEIAKVVPHLDVLVDMAEDAPGEEVVITSTDWRLLRAVAGGCTVSDLMQKLGDTEFDTCKTVKELVDGQLVSIDVNFKPKQVATSPSAAASKAQAQAKAEPRRDVAGVNGVDGVDAEPERQVARTQVPEARRDTDRERERESDRDRERESDARKSAAAASAERSDAAAQLEDLVNEVARPRKVRATTTASGGPEAPEPAPANRPAAKAAPVADEAKALVAQLAALEGENEDKIAKKVEEHLARGGELPDVPEGDEPINRGLLLKFLSSVRN
jgi:hypothetical protein